MEFVIYNSIDDASHIREMISNKFLTINLFEINPKILFKQTSELTNKYGN